MTNRPLSPLQNIRETGRKHLWSICKMKVSRNLPRRSYGNVCVGVDKVQVLRFLNEETPGAC